MEFSVSLDCTRKSEIYGVSTRVNSSHDKIDLDAARPIHVALAVQEWLSLDDPDSIIPTSARSRIGIAELLDAVCKRVPFPRPLEDDNNDVLGLRSLIHGTIRGE
jgi:translation elongation factor EF-4